MVLDNKLCLNCLGNHLKSDCKSQHSCRSCNRKHHSTLHDDSVLQNPRQHSEQPNDNNRISKSTKTFANSKKSPQNTQFAGKSSSSKSPPATNITTNVGALLMVVPGTLEDENIFISTYTFLDSGSTCSYLLSNVANTLHCKITGLTVKLDIEGFTSTNHQETNMVALKIHPLVTSLKIHHQPHFRFAVIQTSPTLIPLLSMQSVNNFPTFKVSSFRSFSATRSDSSWDKTISILSQHELYSKVLRTHRAPS